MAERTVDGTRRRRLGGWGRGLTGGQLVVERVGRGRGKTLWWVVGDVVFSKRNYVGRHDG
jgi:hypothetical protein